MRHKLISAMLCMTLATSCVDMDIAPKNIVTSSRCFPMSLVWTSIWHVCIAICHGKTLNTSLNGGEL